MVVQGQVTPLDETEGRGPHDRLDEEVQVEPDAEGWGWTWETCRGQQRGFVMLIQHTESVHQLSCC